MTMHTLNRKADISDNITSFNGTQNHYITRRTWNSESPHNHSLCKLLN